MAVVAGVAAAYVVQVFPCRCDAVVAGTTNANNLHVIDDIGRCKYIGIMTILAHVAGLNVCRILAGSVDSVMAVDAVIRDICMIEIGWQPADRGMAVVAVIAALNMSRVLTGCCHAIMAGATRAQYLRVVDRKCGCPDI